MEINIEQLADLISDKINTVPITERLWSLKTISNALECSINTARNLTRRPDFPPSYRFPSKKDAAQPRWKAMDVINWAEKYRNRDVMESRA